MIITTLTKDLIQVVREVDVVPFRNRVKISAEKIQMSLINQTKLITAASELVRNMLKYGNGGTVILETIAQGINKGIRLIFTDKGPGIPDIDLAMKDGYSTGKSLGLGLPGARRLVNEFKISSEMGKGTMVEIIKWANG